MCGKNGEGMKKIVLDLFGGKANNLERPEPAQRQQADNPIISSSRPSKYKQPQSRQKILISHFLLFPAHNFLQHKSTKGQQRGQKSARYL
jgi:hypothetical protein